MAVQIKMNSEKNEMNIKVSGRFDFSVHQEFRKASELNTAVKAVIVDLQTTDYIDSSALGMLLILRDKVSNDRNSIRIINAKPEVKKILQIANFDQLFTVV
ncbi:MAG: STAS domain-containing protein [Gammaproteobacteria bacterium]